MNKQELINYIQEQYKGKQPYQTVEFNGEVIHYGTEKCWLSWENINKLNIDWKGKKVLDIGSYFGYFSTKVLQAGAESVVALDQNQELLDVLSNILSSNSFTNFTTIVKLFNKDNTDVPSGFDVTFALNCLHHIKRDSGPSYPLILKNILNSASEVVCEVNPEELEDIKISAAGREITIIDSHRNNRKIIHVKG